MRVVMTEHEKIVKAQQQRILNEYIKNGGKKVYDYKISKEKNHEQNSQDNKI